MAKIKLVICWLALGRKKANHDKICQRFGISDYMSVNKETRCEIEEEDMELLEECQRRGLLEIRYKHE